MRPEGRVVAAPVAGPFPGAGVGGTPDYEGPFGGPDVKQGVVGGVEDLVAEEVVVVVLESSSVVSGVGTYGVHIKGSLDVVDDVWWVFDRSLSWNWGSAQWRWCRRRCYCRSRRYP